MGDAFPPAFAPLDLVSFLPDATEPPRHKGGEARRNLYGAREQPRSGIIRRFSAGPHRPRAPFSRHRDRAMMAQQDSRDAPAERPVSTLEEGSWSDCQGAAKADSAH